MSDLFSKIRQATGFVNQNELYNQAFEKGVLLKKFFDAAGMFEKAAKKFTESGDQMMATQAMANSLLYRYLATGDASTISPLLQNLSKLPQIEVICSREMMPVGPLCAELDCRLVEAALSQAQDDQIRSRDLHKLARDKFQAISRNPLITYSYVPAEDQHNDRAELRCFYHAGMYSFYEAMTKKDSDPSAASDDLSLARQAFQRCNDQLQIQNALLGLFFCLTC